MNNGEYCAISRARVQISVLNYCTRVIALCLPVMRTDWVNGLFIKARSVRTSADWDNRTIGRCVSWPVIQPIRLTVHRRDSPFSDIPVWADITPVSLKTCINT